MDGNVVQAIYGEGKGKTAAALGKSIQAVSHGKKVVFISFLKGKKLAECKCLEKLEPDIKIFCFQKENDYFDNLTFERKEEERFNLLNGFHFANKVVDTGECDVLVLDEVLGLIDLDMISIQDLYKLIEHCAGKVDLIITGKYLPKELLQHIDYASEINRVK
jgi:cob(I)alamin adenosyltransferase